MVGVLGWWVSWDGACYCGVWPCMHVSAVEALTKTPFEKGLRVPINNKIKFLLHPCGRLFTVIFM